MRDLVSWSGIAAMAALVVPACQCRSRFRGRWVRRVGVRGMERLSHRTAVVPVDSLRPTPGKRDVQHAPGRDREGRLLPMNVQGVALLEFLSQEFQRFQRLFPPAEMGVPDVAQRRGVEDERAVPFLKTELRIVRLHGRVCRAQPDHDRVHAGFCHRSPAPLTERLCVVFEDLHLWFFSPDGDSEVTRLSRLVSVRGRA
jgi:hypothetical protein